MQSINLNQVNVINTLFIVTEIFTRESQSVGVNKELNLEIFKEKLDKEKQESDEQLDTRDMAELESEESAAKRRNHQAQGLKILTPNQMLSRLPVTLAQLKAGNNSQKLINEIRQLFSSLYRSKKLTQTIQNHLIHAI